jgi:hypothetical protein
MRCFKIIKTTITHHLNLNHGRRNKSGVQDKYGIVYKSSVGKESGFHHFIEVRDNVNQVPVPEIRNRSVRNSQGEFSLF